MDTPASIHESATAVLIPFEDGRRHDVWHEWHELAAHASPLLAPELFALNVPLAGAGEPVVAEARQDGHLTGVLPLVRDGHTLRALQSDHMPEFDLAGDRDAVEGLWRAIQSDDRWDVLVLTGVPVTSPLATELPRIAKQQGCPVLTRPGARHLFFELQGLEQSLPAKHRANMRRCERKLGGATLERTTTFSREAFEDALAIEAMAWKDAAGTSLGADPRVTHLYEALLRLFGRRGQMSLSFLRAEGKRIAVLLALEDGHTVHALKIGYDPRYAAVGPGHLVVWKVAEDAARRGFEELCFLGHDDEWKRRWTDRTHEHVALVVYRRTVRGLSVYVLREIVKPRLPESMRDLRTPLRLGCQLRNFVGEHSLLERVRGRVTRGLGVRDGLRRELARLRAPSKARPEPLGEPSVHEAGAWVRVLAPDAVRGTLDEHGRTRGLGFMPQQWSACGRTFRVENVVRRLLDDAGRMRPVHRTVRLDGIDCTGTGVPMGCGRHCPLLFRDEWLEPAEAPKRGPTPAVEAPHARVRALDEIRATLDVFGKHDGVTFMPEMAAYAGRRFAIANRIDRVFELDRWAKTRAPLYTLAGLHCTGATLGRRGPCDRGCALLWHRDWLLVEPS
jgi:CelD/BcsL family acetyltransferase involved in cellulose biosynthesis